MIVRKAFHSNNYFTGIYSVFKCLVFNDKLQMVPILKEARLQGDR